jgi:hypothetical protein
MLRLMLTTLLLAACTPALAMYKCESGGKLSYSDTPCTDGKNVIIRDAALQPADATGTSVRLLRDKTEANRLERERHQRESQDEKERLQAARAAARSHKKCDSLALRTKWAEEDAVHAAGKSAAKVKRRARRSAEKYELECGKK